MKRLYGVVRCRTSSTHVNEVYAEQKIQEIFSMMIGGKGKKYQLSVRLERKQVGLSCVYRSYVTYVRDSIQL